MLICILYFLNIFYYSRDSKLTKLLMASFSQKSCNLMIIGCISPDKENAEGNFISHFMFNLETISTLRFAARTKLIVPRSQNEILDDKDLLIISLRKEINTFKRLFETPLVHQALLSTVYVHFFISRNIDFSI